MHRIEVSCHPNLHRNIRNFGARLIAAITSALVIATPLVAQGNSPRREGIIVLGPSNYPSCGQWTAARTTPGDMVSAQYQMWALGFLSGLNWAQTHTRGDKLLTTDSQAVSSWIDLFCRNHPLEPLLHAVIELDKELGRRTVRR